MDITKGSFDAFIKEFMIDFKSTTFRKKEKIYVSKSSKGKILYSFYYNNIKHSLYDDRKTGHNNFVLRIFLRNSKKIEIASVEKIIKYIIAKNIPQKDYYKIEQILMEEVI